MRRQARAIKMAKRGKIETPFIWLHVDIDGLDTEEIRSRVAAVYQDNPRLRRAKVSIARNLDVTEALVKVPAKASWVDTLPAAITRIVRVFTEATPTRWPL